MINKFSKISIAEEDKKYGKIIDIKDFAEAAKFL
jgi:hypothetical protein